MLVVTIIVDSNDNDMIHTIYYCFKSLNFGYMSKFVTTLSQTPANHQRLYIESSMTKIIGFWLEYVEF